MKKGIVVRAFSGNPDFLGGGSFLSSVDDFKRVFERAKQAGYDGVQLFIEPSGFFSLETSSSVVRGIASAASEAGIELSSLEIAPFSISFTTDDETERRRSISHMTRCLEIAGELGAPGLLVIPGWVGLPWDKSAPTVPYDVALDRTRSALQALAPAAERAGVSIMLENIWNRFLLSPLEFRDLLDAVDSPKVKAIFDVGNIVLVGYPEQWIRILGSRIQEVHLKDYRTSVGTVDGFVDLLSGDVNWTEVMAALREIEYDGFLTAEVFPAPHAPDLVIDQTSKAIDSILAL
ncbi:MAG: sugar phosphate isomerase/epimerase [Thermomicrobiales bacterium]|nr:sugar phosphate isomerase/epimerase [Thermomicrobiales bacterium]